MKGLGASSKMSSPRAISELTMTPLYQYADQEPAPTIRVESIGPRSKKAISFECAASVHSKTQMQPWYYAFPIPSRAANALMEQLVVCRIAYFDQEPVALGGAARPADRRVHRDVVALGRPRALGRAHVVPGAEPLVQHALDVLAQGGAVRRGGVTRPAAGLDDAVEHRLDELVRQRPLGPEQRGREGTLGLGLLQRLRRRRDVFRRFAVARRRHEVVEDVGRGDDRRLLRMRHRHLDDLDAEIPRVGIGRA